MHSRDIACHLTDDEIKEFINCIYRGRDDGYIRYTDLNQTLEQAYDDLAQQTDARHIARRGRVIDSCREFSRRLIGPDQEMTSPVDFTRRIRECNIPSLHGVQNQERQSQTYFDSRHRRQKIRAYWAVHGPEVMFIGVVVSSQIAFGAWQLITFDKSRYNTAFGAGVIVAKACSGALYPTFFFLILSVSRYFSTLFRRSYVFSRLLNWDLSRAFHLRISIVALILSTIHAASHLAGTFAHGSRPDVREYVTGIIGPNKMSSLRYVDYVCSIPGLTGMAALGLFYLLGILSMPHVRRWNYNIFQLGHLLIYPIIGLFFAHGTKSLLHGPIFGYFLAFPVLLVFLERLSRIISGFYAIKATLKVLDDETVEIAAVIPKYRGWDYTAGQYIFLQVPEISFFQWHPFTISTCRAKMLRLHIKTSGDWTAKLRHLPPDIEVGINGPFGAPAQRFYEFKYSLIIGSGIGITPFSAILADLQYKIDSKHGGPCRNVGSTSGTMNQTNRPPPQSPASSKDFRRTDFHWIVRDGNSLMWLSDLLNQVSASQEWHRENDEHSHLDIRLNTHITSKRYRIVTHILAWLLEAGRTLESPASLLTGLINPTSFGRPDFDRILDEHYEEMKTTKRKSEESGFSGKSNDTIGVFYCGTAAVGEILADKCEELTIRGRNDESRIKYRFIMEVFG